jgi:hypothetical protein
MFTAKVLLDSVGPGGNRLTTMEFTIPKPWNGEFNTYCMFARNSASTRAIPFPKQVDRMLADSYVPNKWPLEGKGMAASGYETDRRTVAELECAWLAAREEALNWARVLVDKYHIHNQLAGRLLELWQFHTVIVTGDEGTYANFYYQRRDEGAAPEIRESADTMWTAYKNSTPSALSAGEWHMPLLRHEDYKETSVLAGEIDLRQVSAARCARVSYLTHHGLRDVQEDVNLFNRLTQNGHWSPLEHVCQALPPVPWWKDMLMGWLGAQPAGHGKWWAWHQFRKDFPGEYHTSMLEQYQR